MREDAVGSRFFQSYVANINRMHLIEMIDACQREQAPRSFRASLVVNPITGQLYTDDAIDADVTEK